MTLGAQAQEREEEEEETLTPNSRQLYNLIIVPIATVALDILMTMCKYIPDICSMVSQLVIMHLRRKK